MVGFVTSPIPTRAGRQGHGVLLLEGILLAVLGVGAILTPLFAGVVAAGVIGWVLLLVGIVGLVSTFSSRAHLHFQAGLLSSVAALVIGLVIVLDPGAGALLLAWLLAGWLMIDGVSSIMTALHSRRTQTAQWWWLMASGVVDWVVALAIVLSDAAIGIAIVGMLVGIDLLIGGIALLGLARGLRGRAAVV